MSPFPSRHVPRAANRVVGRLAKELTCPRHGLRWWHVGALLRSPHPGHCPGSSRQKSVLVPPRRRDVGTTISWVGKVVSSGQIGPRVPSGGFLTP